ncbi:MFS transporter [Rhizobium laguerreae]|uniref:MFS transporter n=1 Tax=Rhizobium laguerreae TaxID=1076926 RepID=UPI001C91F13B|nr:MFS transporter [Rhizobium laguerreae]MBY3219472.1 MFS transporter [Rhizobium laguerreae]
MDASQPKTLQAFRNRTFRILWCASVVSNTGGMVQLVGAAWLMTILSSSERMVALVQASVTLPLMVFSLVAGVLADNYERRSVMLAAQMFMLVVSSLLATLVLLGLMTPWMLLALTFSISTGTALHYPSWQASFTDLVPREDLPSAATMNAMGMNITRSLGPAIGGVVVATFGVWAAFLINATSYVAIIAGLLAWRPVRSERRLPRESFYSAFGAGMRYFVVSPNIINISIRGFIFGFAAISMQALLPLVARDVLKADAMVYGLLLGAFGSGAVVGALAAARIRSRLGIEQICRLSFAIFALATICVAYIENVWLSCLTIFVGGASWININSLLNVSVQMSVPRWVLGRMIAVFMTFIFGGMALGSWTWGAASEVFGLQQAFLAAAGVLCCGLAWGYRFPIKPYPATDLDPLNHFKPPAIRFDLSRQSGPISIMVEYDIAEDDVAAFLDAMEAWRRIRLRDGARRWSLLRDVEAPERWIESYHVANWTDYIRHVGRRTVADNHALERLMALHRGAEPMRVHRMIEGQTILHHRAHSAASLPDPV